MNTNVMVILFAAACLAIGWGLAKWSEKQKERERIEAEEAQKREARDEIQEVIVPTEGDAKKKRMAAMPFLPEYDPGDMSVTHAFLPTFSVAEDGVRVSVRGGAIRGEILPICARSAVTAMSHYFPTAKKEIGGEFEGEIFAPVLKEAAPLEKTVDLGDVIGFAFFTFEKQFYFRLCSETPGLSATYGPVTLGDAEVICTSLAAVVEAIGPEAIESSIVKIDLGRPRPKKVIVKGAGSPGFGLKA